MAEYSRRLIAFRFGVLFAVAALVSVCPRLTYAQFSGGGLGLPGDDENVMQASAYFTGAVDGKPAMLHVTGDIAPGWHTYSITQQDGGPIKTKIKLAKSNDFKLAGEFKASAKPEIRQYDEIWPKLPVEEHAGSVTWSAPIEFSPGVDVKKLTIAGSIYAQLCKENCLPPANYEFAARLQGPAGEVPTAANQPKAVAEAYKPAGIHAALKGELAANVVRPGGATTIMITATSDPEWHIYAYAEKAPKLGSKPTLIAFAPVQGVSFGKVTASAKPKEEPSVLSAEETLKFHEEPVSWQIPVTVAADVKPGSYTIGGLIGYQTCKGGAKGQCDSPRGAKFSVTLNVAGDASNAKPEAVTFAEGKYVEAAKLAEGQSDAAAPATGSAAPKSSASSVAPSTGLDDSALIKNIKTESSFVTIVFGAFFGGMLLNLMPCVFPVIGLKVLSFVEQSHHNRAKLLSLNLWYTVGVLLVFLGVATAALLLRSWLGIDFKYGSQNGVPAFAIGMAALMFVMALSLLGVWEIPIPGFLGSSKAHEMTSNEGASGAIAKGAITTLLGASCSGPLVAGAFGFALDRGTPVLAVYGTFFLIGLGMATPYLILGANPGLLRFLPKPGPWMDTFKHICGFVLLATMVWVLTWLKPYYLVPTAAFLIGLAVACWWIGRVPYTVSTSKRLQAWGWSIAIAFLGGLLSYDWLLPSSAEGFGEVVQSELQRLHRETQQVETASSVKEDNATSVRLPWQPFSKDRLVQLTREGKTVMVDFTADWCINCKVLEKGVLNTADVKTVVLKNDVVPLIADYTHAPQELTDMLTLLKAGAVPVLAIFPASNPNDPIVFRGGYTQQILIDALNQAGPSKSAAAIKTALNQ